jgi:hypothetical protein
MKKVPPKPGGSPKKLGKIGKKEGAAEKKRGSKFMKVAENKGFFFKKVRLLGRFGAFSSLFWGVFSPF